MTEGSSQPTAPRLLVLGCHAFSGSHFAAHALGEGAQVLGINRSPEPHPAFLPVRALPAEAQARYRFLQGDLNRDLDALQEAIAAFRPTHIADFAGQGMVAESWHAPDQWYQTNVLAKVRLIEFLRTLDPVPRYARVSTPEVYGHTPDAVTEEAPLWPSTPYAVTHAAIDLHLRACHQRYGFPVVMTRSSNFYGPGQQLYRLIPRAFLSGLTRQLLPLHGGGHSYRNFVYIADFCQALWRVMTRATPGEIYHVAGDDVVAIRDLVARIARRLDLPFESLAAVVDDRPGKDLAYRLDTGKIRRDLDWQATTSLDDGLERTLQWIQQHLDTLKHLPWSYRHQP